MLIIVIDYCYCYCYCYCYQDLDNAQQMAGLKRGEGGCCKSVLVMSLCRLGGFLCSSTGHYQTENILTTNLESLGRSFIEIENKKD